MSTIAFFMFPQHGHLNASYKLARSLQRIGHRVCYLSTEEYGDDIRAQKLECVSVFKEFLPSGSTMLEHIDKGWVNDPDSFKHLIADQSGVARRGRSEIAEFIERYKPDLFVVDVFLPAVALLTRELGIHSLFLNPSLNMYHHFFQGELAALKSVPELVLCPQEFELPQQIQAENHRYYIESSVDTERTEPEFAWEQISKDKPLIYCALGSQTHIFGEQAQRLLRATVQAMASKKDWQLVLSMGTTLNPEDFEAVPPNVLLVRHAPQLQMLKRAAMMITHGGLGSVKECILFGVPMIVFPLGRDQPRNAARVVYHHLGVRGDISRVSVEMIHSSIDRIDRDPRFKSSVELMANRFRKIENLSRGATLIDKMIAILKQKSLKQAGPPPGGENLSAAG